MATRTDWGFLGQLLPGGLCSFPHRPLRGASHCVSFPQGE
jgi:hypothetical protein